ncbi:MAG: DNA-binding protein [bacterium]|nr:DNA-binding protein [bacterium]
MKRTVYVETSVVSYLTSRPSRDLVIAANQAITREWWANAVDRFEIYSLQFVVSETGAGDSRRHDASRGSTAEAATLARLLVEGGAVSRHTADDAVPTASGVDFLVTWSFRHIANAALRGRTNRVRLEAGEEPPIICTPNELMETPDVDSTD